LELYNWITSQPCLVIQAKHVPMMIPKMEIPNNPFGMVFSFLVKFSQLDERGKKKEKEV
jgi:hypothetical protein